MVLKPNLNNYRSHHRNIGNGRVAKMKVSLEIMHRPCPVAKNKLPEWLLCENSELRTVNLQPSLFCLSILTVNQHS